MLAENKLKAFHELVSSLSSEELIWVNGFLNGMLAKKDETVAPVTAKIVSKKVTIAYGTETGNSKKIATDFAAKARKNNITVKLVSLDQYRLQDLTKEEYFFAVVSTHGDGEPPVAAKKFHEYIHLNGFKVDKLKYSVLALGDTSYPSFCKTGEEIDDQLKKLGGQRINPITRCDVEFEEDANAWVDKVLEIVMAHADEDIRPAAAPAIVPVGVNKSAGKKIYSGTVLTNINLNDNGSAKETYHIELAVEDVEYEPGDSIGIVPANPAEVVENILSLTNADASKILRYKEEELSIYELLKTKVNILQVTPSVVKKYAALAGHIIPEGKFDLLDLLKQYPLKDVQQFEEALLLLSPIAPRLYTIASSPAAHSGELHITVEKDHFKLNDQVQYGLCSEYLGQRGVDSEIKFFVQKNKRFRLPADDKDVIMIGPGTGIAAFRSFLSERDSRAATGKNWLFFGEENFATDFLYQTEIQNWSDLGVLTNVHVAFSKDTNLFVHHRMLEHGNELYNWLQQGAYVYVCGQKEPMSIQVENALLEIIQTHGNKEPGEAKQYLESLKEQSRYSKDVY